MTGSCFNLEGRIALVTGASRGLGQAIALALAEAGADVCVTARSVASLSETRSRIE
jgi:NAD(P)-dependent dehydrogenase (short-subunit alcohol dehydrogenase family)